MKYLVLNPYGSAYGVRTYTENLIRCLAGTAEVACFSNDCNLSFEDFRNEVAEYVSRTYSPEEVVIEVPEARASAIDVDPAYVLHVRLHGFGAVGDVCNGRSIDRARLAAELSLVRRASVLSSPSYALLPHLSGIVDPNSVHVFKNPPDLNIAGNTPSEKTHDVLFMGRYEVQKGGDLLDRLLELLPASYKVSLIGPGMHEYKPSLHVKCQVENHGVVYDETRFDVLARTRVYVSLSRFENCSMTLIEAVTVGTTVVCWDVGGNSEIAPPPLVRLVPFGDLNGFSKAVCEACRSKYPSPERFLLTATALSKDFSIGWHKIWDYVRGIRVNGSHRGLNYRSAHCRYNPRIPYSPPSTPVVVGAARSSTEHSLVGRNTQKIRI